MSIDIAIIYHNIPYKSIGQIVAGACGLWAHPPLTACGLWAHPPKKKKKKKKKKTELDDCSHKML